MFIFELVELHNIHSTRTASSGTATTPIEFNSSNINNNKKAKTFSRWHDTSQFHLLKFTTFIADLKFKHINALDTHPLITTHCHTVTCPFYPHYTVVSELLHQHGYRRITCIHTVQANDTSALSSNHPVPSTCTKLQSHLPCSYVQMTPRLRGPIILYSQRENCNHTYPVAMCKQHPAHTLGA